MNTLITVLALFALGLGTIVLICLLYDVEHRNPVLEMEHVMCKFCDEGYYPAVNVNGVVIHRTMPTMTVARIVDEKIVPLDQPIYHDGIEICTARNSCPVARKLGESWTAS